MEEKLISVTLEFENYYQKLSGEHAENWMKWVNSNVAMTQIRSGRNDKQDFHDHWEIKTKQEMRKDKLKEIKNNE